MLRVEGAQHDVYHLHIRLFSPHVEMSLSKDTEPQVAPVWRFGLWTTLDKSDSMNIGAEFVLYQTTLSAYPYT